MLLSNLNEVLLWQNQFICIVCAAGYVKVADNYSTQVA